MNSNEESIQSNSGRLLGMDEDDNDGLLNPLVIVTEPDASTESQKTSKKFDGLMNNANSLPTFINQLPFTSVFPTPSFDVFNGSNGDLSVSPSAISSQSSSSSYLSPSGTRLSSGASPAKSPLSASKPKLTAPSKTRRKSDKILPVADEHGLEAFMCPVCQEMLPDNHRLTKHIRSHNVIPPTASTVNTCTICNKVLSSQSSLDRHMLVHSGERPFQCSICGMAFTTNGNMHRHSRIHEKEAADTERTASKMLSEMAARAQRGKKKQNTNSPGIGALTVTNNLPATKGEAATSLLSVTKSLAKPSGKHKLEDENNNSSLLNAIEIDKMSVRKRSPGEDKFANNTSRTVTSIEKSFASVPKSTIIAGSGKIPDDQQMTSEDDRTCPSCGKSNFLSLSGVYVHVASCHSSYPWKCSSCQLVFRSGHLLRSHQALNHGCKKGSQRINTSFNDDDGISAVGFQDLTFVDFSAKKFPQISRVLCESQRRRLAGASIGFSCEHCKHVFPCKSALEVHQCTHFPQYNTNCTACDCRFDSAGECELHSLVHVAESVLTAYTNRECKADEDIHDVMVQEEYMIMLGLKAKQNLSAVTTPKRTPTSSKSLATNYQQNQSSIKKSSTIPACIEAFHVDPQRAIEFETSEMSKIDNGVKKSFVLKQLAKQVMERNKASNFTEKQNDNKSRMSQFSIGGETRGEKESMAMYYGTESSDDDVEDSDTGLLMDDSLTVGQSSDEGHREKRRSDFSLPIGDLVNEGPPFKCKFCDQTFPSMRYWKAHMRTHLGQAPYKCRQCNYSSADKSTLVRHLRTHNGERPFQCTICHFAFTTKANCERHVRKKHRYSEKDDIERLIGYSESNSSDMLSNNLNGDSFNSPDTVCKYCGQDFHYFRDLKHHLRSHSSCQNKPYVCKLCINGFSTKATCVRHIQKQHGDVVSPQQIEDCIRVNDLALALNEGNSETEDELDENPNEFSKYNSLSADSSSSLTLKPMPLFHPAFGAIIPPSVARFMGYPKMLDDQTPVVSTPTLRQQLQLPPAKPAVTRHMLSKTPFAMKSQGYIRPSFPAVKHEKVDEEMVEQPLDFSMKSISTTGHRENRYSNQLVDNRLLDLSVKTSPENNFERDEPMDLSKSRDSFPIPAMLSASAEQNFSNFSKKSEANISQQAANQGRQSNVSQHQMLIDKQLSTMVYAGASMTTPPIALWDVVSKRMRFPFQNMLGQFPFMPTALPSGQMESLLIQRLCSGRSNGAATSSPWQSDASNSSIHSALANANGNKNLNMRPLGNDVSRDGKTLKRPITMLGRRQDVIETNKNLMNKNGFVDVQSPILKQANDVMYSSLAADYDNEDEDDESMEDDDQRNEQYDDEDASEAGSLSGMLLQKGDDGTDSNSMLPRKKKRNSYSNSPHKLRCPQCPRAFPWISSLKRHLLTHTGQKPYKCTHCPIMFSTKSNRERHMIRKHGLDIHDPATRQMMDRPFKCHLCVFSSFSAPGNLLKHYTEKHGEDEIPESVLSLITMSGASDMTSQFEDLADDTCSRQSMTSQGRDNLNNDLDDCDMDSDDSESSKATIAISQSSRPSSTPACIAAVMASSIAEPANPERDNYNVDQITECWKCGGTFDTRKQLQKHLKEHAVDLPFKCYLCDASFESRVECLQHISTRHQGEWEMLRDKNKIDGKIEAFASMLERIVEETLVSSAKNEAMGQQKASESNELVQPGEKASTPSQQQLDDVLHIETDYAQRKVYCAFCAKRFWSLQDLRRHMRSHTGERPFACDICQKRFTLKHSMMRHRRRHTEGLDDAGASYCSDDDNMSLMTTDDRDGVPDYGSTHISYEGRNNGRETSISPTVMRSSDILQNLLGVDSADTLEHMLSSSADKAAEILGISCT